MERQAHKLAKALIEKNIEVEIVTGWWYRGTPQREVLDGIPVFRKHTLWEMFRIRGLRRFGGYLYILTLLLYLWRRRADYDILHVHGLNYHSAAAVLASRWFHRKTLVKLANTARQAIFRRSEQANNCHYQVIFYRHHVAAQNDGVDGEPGKEREKTQKERVVHHRGSAWLDGWGMLKSAAVKLQTATF